MSLTKYYHIAKINFVNNLAYSADIFSNSLFIAVIIFIFTNVWKAIYLTIPAGGTIEGFTIVMVMWYFLTTESIVTAHMRVADNIGNEIKSGDIANQLNKPYNYVLQKYASCLGNSIFKFFTTFLLGSIVVFLIIGGIKVNLLTIPAVLLVIFLALTLHFVILALIGIFAFWFEEVRSLEFLYEKMLFTIGGMLLPISFFPTWLSNISSKLPFGYIAYHPARLFVDFHFDEFLKIALFQIIWIIVFVILISITYSYAKKKVVINGG